MENKYAMGRRRWKSDLSAIRLFCVGFKFALKNIDAAQSRNATQS